MWRPGCGLYKTMAVFERTRTAEVTPARTRTRKLQHYDDCERRSRFAARSMSGAFVGFSTMAECRPGHCLHAANPLLERGCGSGRYWARTSDARLGHSWTLMCSTDATLSPPTNSRVSAGQIWTTADKPSAEGVDEMWTGLSPGTQLGACSFIQVSSERASRGAACGDAATR